MKLSSLTTALILSTGLTFSVASSAFAQTTPSVQSAVVALPSGKLIKKQKKLQGGWEVIQRDGNTYIAFDEAFRASNGPDLKVFLSPIALSEVTGDTALEGSINIGELQKTKGAQEYLIPSELNLADYASVLVHCEEYSVLWGGGTL